MKRFRAEFDEALNSLWPCFDYLLRTSKVSEAKRNNEFNAFTILSKDERKPTGKSPPVAKTVKSPPVAKSPTNKGSKNAFFTESKFNLNNDLKVTANPAKNTGLKDPNPYFNNEPPLLKPEV